VLAYVFWHRPRDPRSADAYEQANVAFHRSIARVPPAGSRGSAFFRVAELPWLSSAGGRDAGPGTGPGSGASAGYESWFLVEDFTALGVLDEAAVGHGHRTTHEQAARRLGAGAGGLYGLRDGRPRAGMLAEAPLALWVDGPSEAKTLPRAEMLADGVDPEQASLWRRRLAFGPAPEHCLLAPEVPAGVDPARLPAGWRVYRSERELLYSD
jgi:hypothetical protein